MIIANVAIALCFICTYLTFIIIPIKAFVVITGSVVASSSPTSSTTSSSSLLKAAAATAAAGDNNNNKDNDVSKRAVGTDRVTELSSVRNLRPLYNGSNLYRSATFDDLNEEDTERLLDGSAFIIDDNNNNYSDTNQITTNNYRGEIVALIDLRNNDEIQKGVKKRTKGSIDFYNSNDDDDSSTRRIRFVSVPILQNVNRFWDRTIDTMDGLSKSIGLIQTIFMGGALDRAAARHLEAGGLSLLYQIMIQTSGDQFLIALNTIVEIMEEDEVEKQQPQQQQQQQVLLSDDDGTTNNDTHRRRPIIIFHCQKGKDRTGVLAMLLQSIILGTVDTNDEQEQQYESGTIDTEIIDSYALSGTILKEFPNNSSNTNNNDDEKQQQQVVASSSSSSTIDWSYFRGSPAYVMSDTLQWIRQEYGSVNQYLDSISFDQEKRSRLRQLVLSHNLVPIDELRREQIRMT